MPDSRELEPKKRDTIVVYKYELKIGSNILALPRFSQALHFGQQSIGDEYKYFVWVRVGFVTVIETRKFVVLGTGESKHEMEKDRLVHIGTLVNPLNNNVWHCFEEIPW